MVLGQNSILRKKSAKKRNPFLPYANRVNSLSSLPGVTSPQHKSINADALRNAYLGKRYLEKFLKQKLRISDIYLDQLNYRFIKGFEKYVKSTPLNKKNPCGQNGAMKHMERLCKMVNLAVKEEWIIRDPFIKYQLKFKKTERGYLTEEELQTIEGVCLAEQRLELVRDLFVLACYSGLSYAEVDNLRTKHITTGIDGEKWITGQRRKSEQFYGVPLLPKAMAVLNKYKDDMRALSAGKC